jgi:hypothetical protein
MNDLKSYINKHKGERCFVIGTGPSLNKTKMHLLTNEILFGVNTLYRGYKKFGIECQYYGVSDDKVWKTHHKEILKLNTTLFIAGKAEISYMALKQSELPHICTIIPVKENGIMWVEKSFPDDLSNGFYWGNTVVIDVCLQLAFLMGFLKVYLVGCDQDYSGAHRFDGLRTENVIDEHRFKYNNTSFEVCKKAYKEAGREIINCTEGGKLDVFKRKLLEEVI